MPAHRSASLRRIWTPQLSKCSLFVWTAITFAAFAFAPAAPAVAAKLIPPHPSAHTLAPDFTLVDSGGKSRTLSSFRGHPVALFFFCGCPWCEHCARLWGQMQRESVLPADTSNKRPLTLIVFSGDADSAKQFAIENGMDLKQTILLPDVQMQVTDLYQADPCPRVFVLDSAGAVRYTNNHKDDTARQAPEMVIVSRALAALRKAAAPAK